MATRALVRIPDLIRKDEVIEVRATVGHPMETGFRLNDAGLVMPRNLVRRVEARFEDEPIFAADLHPAIAANPYLSFWLRAGEGGTLLVRWTGDNGFSHSESVRIQVA
jgi:sulfur-oxidizing protein SoxZ